VGWVLTYLQVRNFGCLLTELAYASDVGPHCQHRPSAPALSCAQYYYGTGPDIPYNVSKILHNVVEGLAQNPKRRFRRVWIVV
jgi:hypothetical protein